MNQRRPVLVEVRRGAIVESVHRGVIVAIDPEMRVRERLGDENIMTSTRSAIKPFQALPVITSDAADHFGFTPREIAVTCASHEGEPIHTETVAAMPAGSLVSSHRWHGANKTANTSAQTNGGKNGTASW